MTTTYTDVPPEGLIQAQRLAIQVAEEIAATAAPGQTEAEVQRIANARMEELGSTGLWTPTNVGFGAGTLSCFPTDVASDRVLWNLDLGFVDVHPTTADGWYGDCTRTFQTGDNPAQAHALETVEKIHAAVLAAARPGMRACDWFGEFQQLLEPTGYLLLDRLQNIGHSINRSSSYDEGYIDAWNETALKGAWAVEPFIGNHLYGVKREDIVWFGPSKCVVIT